MKQAALKTEIRTMSKQKGDGGKLWDYFDKAVLDSPEALRAAEALSRLMPTALSGLGKIAACLSWGAEVVAKALRSLS